MQDRQMQRGLKRDNYTHDYFLWTKVTLTMVSWQELQSYCRICKHYYRAGENIKIGPIECTYLRMQIIMQIYAQIFILFYFLAKMYSIFIKSIVRFFWEQKESEGMVKELLSLTVLGSVDESKLWTITDWAPPPGLK